MAKISGVTVPKHLEKAVRFFADNGGWSKPQNGKKSDAYYQTVGALELAKAEYEASQLGWTVEWEQDDHPWDSDDDYEPKEVLVAVLKNEDGEVIGSLGGIADPTRSYARVVAAELADEAFAERNK